MEVTAIKLATEEDWQAQKDIFENLEKVCPISPYLSWPYTHKCWKTFTPDVPSWMILVSDSAGRQVAGTIWREYVHLDRQMVKNSIRSFDHIFFMRIPPMLVQSGFETQAYEALVGANSYLKKTTKADMVSLYRQNRQATKSLVEALEKAEVTHRNEDFVEAPQLILGDEFENWLMENHWSTVKHFPRLKRRLAEKYGGEVAFVRVQAHLLNDEEYRACLDRYYDMFKATWQFEYQSQADDVDNELTNRFTEQAFDIWRAKKLLNYYFLKVGDTDLAYYVTLERESLVEFLLTGYFQESKKFSPGQIAFVELLRTCHQRGFRVFDMGGEMLSWKAKWANNIDQSIQLEWPLGGLGGKVWSLARRLKKN